MKNLWLGLIVAAGLGCSDLGPDRPLVVQSTAASYKAGTSATFILTNRSNQTHTLSFCGPSGKIDRHGIGGWIELTDFGGFCITINPPLSLAPGQSHQFAIGLGHASYIGTLRIRVTAGERILAVSNEFNVTD